MSEEWKAYVADPRPVCKYGAKCYQKNPEHHKTFKHPPEMLNKMKYHFSRANKIPKKRAHNSLCDEKNVEENVTKKVNKAEDIAFTNSVATSSQNERFSTDVSIELSDKISYVEYNLFCHEESLKALFGVEMPLDFYNFYECLKNDSSLKHELASVHLELVGPFDLLMGKLPVVGDKDFYLVHYRFFYDPPEYQTVLKKKGKSEYHIGYFRDSPDEMPVFLATNDSSKDYHLTPTADNIFGAIYLYLQNEKKSSPFTSVTCQKLMEKVKKMADIHKYSVNKYNMKKRLTQSITKTFHGAGIVVPYNKNTQLGYRKLVETDATIRKLFLKLEEAKSQNEKDQVLSELQPVITYANIAVDEGDFGTGFELGIALFCSGLPELQPIALNSLCTAYSLLKRDLFSKIIQTHIKYRRKGSNVSLLGERSE